MKIRHVLFTVTAVLLAGCGDQKLATELKDDVKEQREAQQATNEQLRETSKQVNELLIRNEAIFRQMERLAALEAKLSNFELKRLEELKEAIKPRNVSVDTAIESVLKLTALTDPKIREMACPLLSLIGGKKGEERLLELVKTDRDPGVRSKALKGLVEMNSQQVTPVLNDAIMTSEGRNLDVMTGYLKDHCDETSRGPSLAVLQTLKNFADSRETLARANLYSILAKVGKPEDSKTLKVFLDRERNKTGVMTALLQIDRKGAIAILNQSVATAKPDQLRYLAQFLEKHADESSRIPILTALDNLISSEDYRARQAREYLYKALVGIVKPEDNLKLEKLLKSEPGDRRRLLEMYVKTGEGRKKAVFKQLERSTEGHNTLSKEAFVSFSKYADIRATDFLVKYLTKRNDYNTTPIIITTLIGLKDPKAASTLIVWSKRARTQSQRFIASAFVDGYPGVVYDEKAKKASLVPDAKMKALMEQRKKTLIQLETGKVGKDQPKPPAPVKTN